MTVFDEIIIPTEVLDEPVTVEILEENRGVPMQRVDRPLAEYLASTRAELAAKVAVGKRILLLMPTSLYRDRGSRREPVLPCGAVLPVFLYRLKAGIGRSPEFERKMLAEFGVNDGVACGHSCAYGSCRVTMRRHRAFQDLGLNPLEIGYAIVDPLTVERVRRDARSMKKRGLVMLSPATDAWSPEARLFGLGRGCAEAILAEPGWTLRVLTKSAAVRAEFDLFQRHRDRVLVGLSTSFLPSDSRAAEAVEPLASPPQERLDALLEAHRRGLRTYGMLCPLISPFYETQREVDEAFNAILPGEPEEIFAEVVNPRGKGLIHTAEALRLARLPREADAVDALRHREHWSGEASRVIHMLVDASERLYDPARLRILVYPSGLSEADEHSLRRIAKGLVWLGRGRTDAKAS